ncbi:hypothetical protein GGR54DRAFT_629506 [Hypoxylon sp. NC1633]|nr:hypothetical protein GGR54DRAFT_629506 [Hypoxylon sp. NC1633]
MEKDTRQSNASDASNTYSTTEEPFFLPSTFSPWRTEDEMDSTQPSHLPSPLSPSLPPSPEMSQRQLPSRIRENTIPRRPVPRHDSGIKPSIVVGARPINDDFGMGNHGVTEVVITAGDATQLSEKPRGPSRRTKFKELLGRSLSSNPSHKMGSSSPTNNYDAIGEEPMAPMDHPTENFSMDFIDETGQVRERHGNHYVDDNDINIDELAARYNRPPLDCHSRRDVYVKRCSWTYISLTVLSIYSTLLSGLWFIVAIYQPRYGRGISSSEGWKMAPSTATLTCTLIAKTIELSFVTVFVAFLGQVLTRRAFVRQAKGVTLAEMTMRNWVIQPGSLLTYWEGIPYAAPTILGTVTLIGTLCAMFYTTASDAMVSPKLKFGEWESQELEGLVAASYANPFHVRESCMTPIDLTIDPNNSAASCLDVQYSGQSYRNLMTFMNEWHDIHNSGIPTVDYLGGRPVGKHNLFDNTTMVSSWIETEFSDPQSSFTEHSRIINNVTLAMPHAGVYSAATDPHNDILQPDDLAGVGEYSIRASVVSPVVNVMCVNMGRDELAPLVYTRWPNARTERTEVPDQRIGVDDWFNDVPPPTDNEWLNKTAADDVFRWGRAYKRRPPVFPMYPINYNMITNTTVANSDSVYTLAKSGDIDDFTVCQLRSWVTPKCSTEFDVSGISGSNMRAHCEDPSDPHSYFAASGNDDIYDLPYPTVDWRNVADEWRLSMDLNGGVQNNNASNARILAHMILQHPALDTLLPSMAEALAVLASSTLITGSLGSTYRARWNYTSMQLYPSVYEPFKVSMRTQQYTSSHTSPWQGIFYPVLGLVLVINIACLAYMLPFRRGLVSDYTEPQNLFAVAVNSPPSAALAGSCGHGPDSAEMVVPWRVGYSAAANHYFFEEAQVDQTQTSQAGVGGGGGKARHSTSLSTASGSELLTPPGRASRSGSGRFRTSHNYDHYKSLSGSRSWL